MAALIRTIWLLFLCFSATAQTISYFNQGFLRQTSAELDRRYLGINSTNDVSSLGAALTNFILSVGANATNNDLLFGQNATNNDLLFGANSTNFSLLIGASATNNDLVVSNNIFHATNSDFSKFTGDISTNQISYSQITNPPTINNSVVAPGQSTSVRTNGNEYRVDVTGTLTNNTTGNALTATKASFVDDLSTNKLNWNNVTNQPTLPVVTPGQSTSIRTNGVNYSVDVTGTLTNSTTGNASTATKATYVADASTNQIPVSGVTNAGTMAYSNAPITEATVSGLVTDLSQRVSTNDTRTLTWAGPISDTNIGASKIVRTDGGNVLAAVGIGSGVAFDGTTLSATGSGGTVTSVGITPGAGLVVSGSPVTGNGSITVTAQGFIWTNNLSTPGTLSNSVTMDAAHTLSLSNATASHVLQVGADSTVSSVSGGAVPIDGDGSATTFPQVNALAPQYIVTNNNANVLVLSNAVKLDAAHSLSLSNATASTIATFGADKTVGSLANGGNNTVLHGTTAPAYSAVVEADQTLADNTTANVSTSAHGYAPKAPNDATKYLDGTAAYSIPTVPFWIGSSGNGGSPAASTVYHFGVTPGNFVTATATHPQYYALKCPFTGHIKEVHIHIFVGGTLASSGNVTYMVTNITAATSVSLTAAAMTAVAQDSDTTGLSFAVTASDQIAVRLTTPAWSTAPTVVVFGGNIMVGN